MKYTSKSETLFEKNDDHGLENRSFEHPAFLVYVKHVHGRQRDGIERRKRQ